MRSLVLMLVLTFLAGCSLAPRYERPVQSVPESWETASGSGLEREWWRRFQDERLNALVALALKRNQDLEQSLARVDAARAALGLARAERFPLVSAQGEGTRARESLDASPELALAQGMDELSRRIDALEGRTPGTSTVPSRTGTMWTGTVQAVWELDFWGKFRNAEASDRASLASAEETRDAFMLTLAGQVCSAYFDLLSYDAQLDLTRRTLESRRESLALYEKQYAAGAIDELDILNARTQVDSMLTSLAAVTTRKEQAESALLLLTGASPSEIYAGTADRETSLERFPDVPQLPVGLPSELLERRPDIRAAEHALQAANFQVGVARAAFFPSISLTGILGTESSELHDLFSGPASTWSLGGSVSFPLLTFGRTMSDVRQSEAVVRQAAAAYRLAVQQAFQEIRDALAAQKGTAESVESLNATASRMDKAASLARLRYEQGYVAYLDVLEAERTLYNARMALAQGRAAQLSAVTQVCVALGGGWEDKREHDGAGQEAETSDVL